MKNNIFSRMLLLMLAAALLILSSCSSNKSTLKIAVESPQETVDIVHPEIRTYMQNAEQYIEGDYSYSVKTISDLGNMSVAAIFSWNFNGNQNIQKASILYAKDKDLASAKRIEVSGLRSDIAEATAKLFNLETGVTYYWCVEAITDEGEVEQSKVFSFTTEAGPRILHIDGVMNARDLGGWNTKGGKVILQSLVYRTAALYNAPESGMRIILDDLGVKTEIDLRDPIKERVFPALGEAVKYINIPGTYYTQFWEKTATARDVMRIFADPANYPILFHCAGGADRTGAVAFCLNALCGVDELDLVMDYELTNDRFRSGSGKENSHDFPGFIMAIRNMPGETLQQKVYGFLHDKCSMSDMELYNITAMMTTDAAVFTPAPDKPAKVQQGQASFNIDPRSSGKVEKVIANSLDLVFTFESGVLTVETSTTDASSAIVVFTDGTEMPIAWSN